MKTTIQGLLLVILISACTQSSAQELSRDQAWRADLDYLKQFAEDTHFHLYHTISRETWNSEMARIHEEIPSLTDLQIIGEIMRLLVKVNDGHTLLYPPFQGKYAFQALPLMFYLFEEDLYVLAADPQYSQLVGKKITEINGLATDIVIDRVEPYINRDNQYQVKWIMPIAMQFAEMYQLTGVSDGTSPIQFTVQNRAGEEESLPVAYGPLSWDPMSRFGADHWTKMQPPGSSLWTKDPDNYYWYQYLQDSQVLYFQFNQVRDKENQPITEFVHELTEAVDAHPTRALVIDLRLNNGGNNFLNQSLVHALIRNDRINQKGKLFTIIGRRTFSAAMNLASDLERHTQTLFVGEPTGSSPNFYGEDNTFQLPHSGLNGSISSRYWQGGITSDDSREWIEPDLPAVLTATDFQNHRDPCLEAIFNYLQQQ